MERLVWLRRGLAVLIVSMLLLLAIADPAPAGGGRRTIYLSALEYKGGTNVANEAYPPAKVAGTKPLSPKGGDFGYRLKPPDATGRWEVESYRFEPGFTAARLGERVRLEIVGINGALHESRLVSPSGEDRDVLVVTRGRLTLVLFKADEPGVWQLICDTHPPAMTADILVF